MPNITNWGTMATGKIAHTFAKAVLSVSDAKLYACASRSAEKAAEFDITREGYHAACDWVEEQVRVWLGEHKFLSLDLGIWSKPPEENPWERKAGKTL